MTAEREERIVATATNKETGLVRLVEEVDVERIERCPRCGREDCPVFNGTSLHPGQFVQPQRNTIKWMVVERDTGRELRSGEFTDG